MSGLPFQPHSETSKDAADAAAPKATTERERVHAFILAQQKVGQIGSTDEETAITLDMNPSTVRPRRVELLEQGRVQDSGQRRLTKSGRKAVVWEPVIGKAKPVKKRARKLPHCSTCTCKK